jgi:purine nucleoside phosphorylase
MHILGLSLITNKVVMPGQQRTATPASHQEVLEAVIATQNEIEHYVRDVLVAIGSSYHDETLLGDEA